MKRTRFTDEQIIGILSEREAGAKCADPCRKHRMSEGTFFNWKVKSGKNGVAKRLKALEHVAPDQIQDSHDALPVIPCL